MLVRNFEEIQITPEIQSILENPSQKYKKWPLTKKSGGVRWISAPVPPLKALQTEILTRIEVPQLTQITSEGKHNVITGFTPGMSIVDNARPHVGKRVVLSMDLKDFFGSIRLSDLRKYMSGWSKDQVTLFEKICFTSKGLPQGSPASPMLANVAALIGDTTILKTLENLLVQQGIDIAYTRYADDLTFSGDYIPQDLVDFLVQKTDTVFGSKRIKFAPNKIKFMRRHRRQIVTGIIVNEKLSIPRERRMRLRAIKHRIETRGIDSVDQSFHEVMGELSYLHLTDSTKSRELINLLLGL